MARLGFSFQLQLSFSEPVTRHAFALRCLPQSSARQQVLTSQLRVMPDCSVTLSQDCFGLLQSGTILTPHAGFSVQAEGSVEISDGVMEQAAPLWQLGPYRRMTQLTTPGSCLTSLCAHLPEQYDADDVMSLLADCFAYRPGSTHAATTAEEAAESMQGVCQDEAHIMLTLLRMQGIPCRYVMGYMLGEGSTHAWVEALQGECWAGFDPTNRRLVNDEYIRIAVGRDANDCPVNRGVFSGIAQQQSQNCLSVWRMYE